MTVIKDCEMYDHICKDRFDKLEQMSEVTLGLLRGSNGEPGLLEEFRQIKRSHRLAYSAFYFLAGAVALEAVSSSWHWLSSMW